MKTDQITISGAGPHAAKFVIPAPADGGVVILSGSNGIGKSHILSALGRLVTGKGDVAVSDDADKATAEWGSARLTVGKRSTISGELQVLAMDGLNVSDFVDPGLKDPLAADAARIRKLLLLSGARVGVAGFHDLLGGKEAFEAIVPDVADDPDPCKLAAAIKRQIESAARTVESQAEAALANAKAQTPLYADVDLDDEHDDDKLRREWDAARAADIRIGERERAAEYADSLIAQARESLAAEVAAYADGPTIQRANEALSLAAAQLGAADQAVETAQAALDRAYAEQAKIRERCKAADLFQKNADKHAATVANWQKQIDTPRVTAPTAAEVAEVAKSSEFAKYRYDRGGVIRAAIKAKAEHDRLGDASLAATVKAKQLREAAAGTEDILTGLVAKLGMPFSVRKGRLCYKTDRDDHEIVSDLSHGERVKLGIDIVVNSIPKGGTLRPCLILDGVHWSALQPSVQNEVNLHAKANRCLIFSECPTDATELSASEFKEV